MTLEKILLLLSLDATISGDVLFTTFVSLVEQKLVLNSERP